MYLGAVSCKLYDTSNSTAGLQLQLEGYRFHIVGRFFFFTALSCGEYTLFLELYAALGLSTRGLHRMKRYMTAIFCFACCVYFLSIVALELALYITTSKVLKVHSWEAVVLCLDLSYFFSNI